LNSTQVERGISGASGGRGVGLSGNFFIQGGFHAEETLDSAAIREQYMKNLRTNIMNTNNPYNTNIDYSPRPTKINLKIKSSAG
jgi:hypothetical protein